ncbi:hypothetical protein [Bacillus sp. 1P06AnD]|uniref:hypothetical protein n=1 Tax=Bacillus sp. 1P06AnD TaxID=3132208 RepID=UPI0039A259B3
MNANTYNILGWVFVLFSGLVFTLEKIRETIVFVGENVAKGSFQVSPFLPSIVDNLVSIIFIVISVMFFYKAISSKTG